MALTLNGDGTIAGLAAGGLSDLSVATADIADAAITAAKLNGAQSGSAPIYGARAWVNFDGTGVVAIRASGNVTSITDNGTGDYTVNFTTALADANYSFLGSGRRNSATPLIIALSIANTATYDPSTTTFRFQTRSDASGAEDPLAFCVSIFR